ncbi:MAG: hypothetical protein ACMXYG_02565 [Candidatus Woesearchaeota archaeon]
MDLFTKKNEPGAPNVPNSPGQKAQPAGNAQTPNYAKDINDLSRRVRIDEERSVNLRKKIQMIEHNMLINNKRLLTEIKFLNQEITEIKRSFDDLKTKVMGFAHELQQCAKNEDVRVLERYINMWEPVKFITSDEVEKIIEEKIDERLNKS